MTADIGIVVGKGQGGQEKIVHAVEEAGFPVITTSLTWPRDAYVHFGGRYVQRYIGSEWNPYGEGGNFRLGKDFMMLSDLACGYPRREFTADSREYMQMAQGLRQECAEHHPSARVHIAPSGFFHGHMGHGHIDMFTLLCPQARLLVLDMHYGRAASQAREYHEIAEKEGLRLQRYDGYFDSPYPLNSLVCTNNNRDIVFLDARARVLMHLMESSGVEYIPIHMPTVAEPKGKINCQTNTFLIKDMPYVKGLISTFEQHWLS